MVVITARSHLFYENELVVLWIGNLNPGELNIPTGDNAKANVHNYIVTCILSIACIFLFLMIIILMVVTNLNLNVSIGKALRGLSFRS